MLLRNPNDYIVCMYEKLRGVCSYTGTERERERGEFK